ncbi:MAG TPA: isocitrate lyase/phosphoenolpyruvate mutase family protein [Chthoniobacterales bacterium]|nr:isocitrate lyase/phosphoenolpyruvate mutase family protein [Chthoniobacterales bacterium]
MQTVADKRNAFRELHENGCFALPNPWDIGSAKYLEHLGFRAIATTSAGFAFSHGLADGAVDRDLMLAHIREIVEATDLPVNADFENGYADGPGQVAENVQRCVETGVAGLSIEDNSARADKPLCEVEFAVERIRAARAAIGESGVLLTGRAECFLVGVNDIDEVIRRLTAYAEAGADCLYAPGIREPEHVAAVVKAVAPKPVNLLISAPGGLTMRDAANLGVRRVSVGGALARAAWGGFIRAAKELAGAGSFGGFAGATPHGELQEFFKRARDSVEG